MVSKKYENYNAEINRKYSKNGPNYGFNWLKVETKTYMTATFKMQMRV